MSEKVVRSKQVEPMTHVEGDSSPASTPPINNGTEKSAYKGSRAVAMNIIDNPLQVSSFGIHL